MNERIGCYLLALFGVLVMIYDFATWTDRAERVSVCLLFGCILYIVLCLMNARKDYDGECV